MAEAKSIAYYISAHGYGHGVRSCDVIRALNEMRPDLRIYAVTTMPESFLRNRLHSGSNTFRRAAFDLGMVQSDSIRVDVPATLREILKIYDRRCELIEQEVAFLERHDIAAIVVDIPSIPLEAAARAGRPRLAVGNFGWNWIYSEFVPLDRRWKEIVGAIEEGYRQADLLLRLPFSESMEVFPRIENLPVLASPGRNRRSEIAKMTGARERNPWILVSFTSLAWDDYALSSVEHCKEYEFFTVLPLAWERSNIFPIDRERVPFSDVMASVDAVLSKPGYGVISECIVNGKPLVYADRENFLEYHVLEDAIKRYLRNVHIPSELLYRGDLSGALNALKQAPDPSERPEVGGATVAARRILDFLT